jgi:hexosaminidase
VGDFPAGNSWCEPFKTWKNVRSFPFPRCPRLKLPLPDTRHSARHRAQAYTFQPPRESDRHASEARIGRPTAPMNRAVRPAEPRLDRMAVRRGFCRGVLTGPGEDVRTALSRLHEFGYWFRRCNVHAISLQPEWCELCPFVCG